MLTADNYKDIWRRLFFKLFDWEFDKTNVWIEKRFNNHLDDERMIDAYLNDSPFFYAAEEFVNCGNFKKVSQDKLKEIKSRIASSIHLIINDSGLLEHQSFDSGFGNDVFWDAVRIEINKILLEHGTSFEQVFFIKKVQ